MEEAVFNCPNCNKQRRVEEVVVDATHSTVIDIIHVENNENNNGRYASVEYSPTEEQVTGGLVDRFQCHHCGYVLTDADGKKITDSDDLLKCPQVHYTPPVSYYKVQLHFIYGWDNAPWTEEGEPMVFRSKAEAQKEIDEVCDIMKHPREDYRIVEVKS